MTHRLLVVLIAMLATGAVAHAADRAQLTGQHRQSFDEIERGRYLAIAGDCSACHTTPPDGKPYAGGRTIETPFGDILAANLTPDRETGIGAWSDDEFVTALRHGKGLHGQHLYPAMPYPYFTKMSRADALAIRAYLDALEPVHNPVHRNKLPFPFDMRAGMIGWNMLFFSAGGFKPDPGKPADWNRGAYLVEGLGHCGACHTPKNLFGGDKQSHALTGGVLQGWFSPDLTGDQNAGLGAWSAEDIATYLKTGRNRIVAATGPMAEVISDSTSKLTDADLSAIAAYLKSLPASSSGKPQPVAADDPAMVAGQAIYADNCSACHDAKGTGTANLAPPLKGSPIAAGGDPTGLIEVVLHGTKNVATDAKPTGPSMPAYGWKLTDAQAAAVLTYIRNSWGNAASAVGSGAVKKLRAAKEQASVTN